MCNYAVFAVPWNLRLLRARSQILLLGDAQLSFAVHLQFKLEMERTAKLGLSVDQLSINICAGAVCSQSFRHDFIYHDSSVLRQRFYFSGVHWKACFAPVR